MNDIDYIAGSPATLTIQEQEIVLHPFRLSDLGALQAWSKSNRARRMLADLAPVGDERIKIWRQANTAPANIDELLAFEQELAGETNSIDGLIEQIRLSMRDPAWNHQTIGDTFSMDDILLCTKVIDAISALEVSEEVSNPPAKKKKKPSGE